MPASLICFYLSQQAVPSMGCAQQASSLSFGAMLGVQHTEEPFFGAQHRDTSDGSSLTTSTLLFASTGISSGNSIIELISSL
jgi:hypothetical protein